MWVHSDHYQTGKAHYKTVYTLTIDFEENTDWTWKAAYAHFKCAQTVCAVQYVKQWGLNLWITLKWKREPANFTRL